MSSPVLFCQCRVRRLCPRHANLACACPPLNRTAVRPGCLTAWKAPAAHALRAMRCTHPCSNRLPACADRVNSDIAMWTAAFVLLTLLINAPSIRQAPASWGAASSALLVPPRTSAEPQARAQEHARAQAGWLAGMRFSAQQSAPGSGAARASWVLLMGLHLLPTMWSFASWMPPHNSECWRFRVFA